MEIKYNYEGKTDLVIIRNLKDDAAQVKKAMFFLFYLFFLIHIQRDEH